MTIPEIDYAAMTFRRGGHLAKIPKPHVRKWPGCPRKRRVKVEMLVYYGLGRHWYVTVREENNPVWDSRPHGSRWGNIRPEDPCGWTEPWDDAAGYGRCFDGRFDTKAQALWWVEGIVAEHFPEETHEVTTQGGVAPWRWYYREGD